MRIMVREYPLFNEKLGEEREMEHKVRNGEIGTLGKARSDGGASSRCHVTVLRRLEVYVVLKG